MKENTLLIVTDYNSKTNGGYEKIEGKTWEDFKKIVEQSEEHLRVELEVVSDFRPIGGYAELLIRKHRRIAELGLNKQFEVKGNFNGIDLRVDSDSTVQSIIDCYYSELKRRRAHE